ncbi:MAG TPA: 4Fe-4S dicluster domain-containing protein [bacterium]|nr:4Fe-4S dicluster domain-containing protein [bacterium]HQG46069.1 4Fe-4S dicluster domain-containing protein [bacterium]HQI48988.1 4Fe-4S dicluster domain-containing protein [bacterium]HQJ63852.1 4Fe-4S dicluster domain-containing protein [bacterium]
MSAHAALVDQSTALADRLYRSTGVDVNRCYQCGKCSAGCPLAAEMEYPSSVLMRLLQIRQPEMDEKALRSHSIWLCLSCETCFCRCPMEIDIPKVADFLRAEAARQNKVHRQARNILRFHKSFLDVIHYTGRLYEVGLIADYKSRSWNLLQDVAMAPVLYLKGKLELLPHRVKNRRALRRLYQQSIDKEDRS